ncbi:ATPase, T2SS/T4P/T4SS family [Psychrobacter lutiphocae]|uniref:ATPase, T2SS/T4P/T4SS family n=1 Tax=Psychrobacter lutiphocae TaxID=540500 RepID=UPI0003809AB0
MPNSPLYPESSQLTAQRVWQTNHPTTPKSAIDQPKAHQPIPHQPIPRKPVTATTSAFSTTNTIQSTSTMQPSSPTKTATATDPIVKLVDDLLIKAVELKASDLHFEPYERTYRVRFRIDGLMQQVAAPDIALHSNIAARLKVMAQMDIAERRLPQDGRIKLALTEDRQIDFRVNSLPTLFGEKIVLRVIDPLSSMVGIDNLGLEPQQKLLLIETLQQPQGVILITGPTGSGKTVSLYTGLDILNTQQVNISSVEDPVEFNLHGINQVNVNHKIGLTFATALKSFLRQDPDIVMVGEIRDLETADTVIKASQTGHLVLSTLHTNSAATTLTRLHNMGVPYFNIATAISLVVAQRLARRLCSLCKKPTLIPATSLIEMGLVAAVHTANSHPESTQVIYEAVGCEHCHNGYKGRIGIFEIIKIDEGLAQIIMQGGNAIDIKTAAIEQGFFDLRQAAILKVLQGLISIAEMYRVTTN